MVAPVPTPPVGSVVAGRYRVDAVLGQGGFGVVLQATQLNLNRPVALKMLRPDRMTSPEVRTRFEREAQLAQRLTHPNTVRLYDSGVDEHGALFIAWEYLKGQSLAEAIAQSGPMPMERVAHIARQVLLALGEAHALGIVHRDIKPANVMLCPFPGQPDFVKVLDFGVAKEMDPGHAGVTTAGSIVGSPRYASPEQALARQVVPGSDLYSLALTMGEMLSGAPIAQGPTPTAVLMMHASAEPLQLPPAVLGSPLRAAIERALIKEPTQRLASAEAMRALIDAPPPVAMGTALPHAHGMSPVSPGLPPAPPQLPPMHPDGPHPPHAAHAAHAPHARTGRRPMLGIAIGLGAVVLGGGGLLWALARRAELADRTSRDDEDDEDDEDEEDADDDERDDDDDRDRPGNYDVEEGSAIIKGRDLDDMSVKRLKKRLRDAGFDIGEVNRILTTTTVQLEEEGKLVGHAQFYDFNDDVSPSIMMDAVEEDMTGAWTRHGRRVLMVELFGGLSQSVDLLEEVTDER